MGATNAFGLPEPEKLFVRKFGVRESESVAATVGEIDGFFAGTFTEQAANYSAEPSGVFTYQMLCEMLDKVRDAPMWVSAQQQLASAEMIHERLDRWFPGWRERSGA